ncbi:chorismate-binding protein [Demequina silvatica]|uniref:chorismate-binding protein n=1 Tax=Demequina silvatica TaxID=1638988 RepID=UPI0007831C49|nr:chorismate-binding protein [Demequina silvatica]
MTWQEDPRRAGSAAFRGVRASRPVECVDLVRDGARVAEGGFWVVVATFEGALRAWRMADAQRDDAGAGFAREEPPGRAWEGPSPDAWSTSLDRDAYMAGVEAIRADIGEGDVYQVNLCRMLEAPLPAPEPGPDAVALAHRLATGNPARFASRIVIPRTDAWPGVWVVSASPELYLRLDGDRVASSPIKGTAAPGEAMLPKDEAENVMITDLIRNDVSHVAAPGSVAVPELLGLHELPGLVHLQSTVEARLAPAYDWTPELWLALLDGTFPPGSVSGAPKSSALRIIEREEPTPRGAYCGGIGWIDADSRTAELAVGIRTFEWVPDQGGRLRFGTGAGITWGSDPYGEWEETELKARRLIALASGATMTP